MSYAYPDVHACKGRVIESEKVAVLDKEIEPTTYDLGALLVQALSTGIATKAMNYAVLDAVRALLDLGPLSISFEIAGRKRYGCNDGGETS